MMRFYRGDNIHLRGTVDGHIHRLQNAVTRRSQMVEGFVSTLRCIGCYQFPIKSRSWHHTRQRLLPDVFHPRKWHYYFFFYRSPTNLYDREHVFPWHWLMESTYRFPGNVRISGQKDVIQFVHTTPSRFISIKTGFVNKQTTCNYLPTNALICM